MSQILPFFQLIVSILLVMAILLQQRGAGSSAITGGGGGGTYYAKRGFERILFIATIVLSVFFIGSALINILI